MSVSAYFSSSYKEAREKFLAAAREKEAKLYSYELPGYFGPSGEVLAMDVAKIEPNQVDSVLLLISGTHGVEGFTGSGCQTGFLADELYEALPQNTAVILVHSVNPYGFAWLRRVNEDNIDLNRNFQDFSNPQLLPDAAAYGELHPSLVPEDWDGKSRQIADFTLQQYILREGMPAFQTALQGGQYNWPTGLFYGGRQEAWSSGTFRRLLKEHIHFQVKQIVSLDIHTGLGPSGYGEPIFIGEPGDAFDRARRWFGPELTRPEILPSENNSVAAIVHGSLTEAFRPFQISAEVTSISLEFGTVPILNVLTALWADHWLHAVPGRQTPLYDSIKQQMVNSFYVDTPAWKAAVYGRTADFVLRAGRGLTAG